MLKPLIKIALKLLRIKVKTKPVIIQAPMESMRQISSEDLSPTQKHTA